MLRPVTCGTDLAPAKQHRLAVMGCKAAAAVLLLACFLNVRPSVAQFEHSTVGNLGKDFDEQIADGRLHFVKLYAPW